LERATGIEPVLPTWESKFSILYFQYLQNRLRKINVHALHTVHALPDLRIAAGRLRDGVSFESDNLVGHLIHPVVSSAFFMAKKRGQRRRRKVQKARTPKQPPTQAQVEQSKNDLSVARRIAWTSILLMALTLIPAGLMMSSGPLPREAEILRWITLGSAAVLTLTGFWLIRAGLGLLTFEPKPLEDVRAFRKNGVWTLSICCFLNVNEWIPIFYERGYLSRASHFILGSQKFGDKLTLGGTFILGAIASGIFGNLSYDILKTIFRKMIKKS